MHQITLKMHLKYSKLHPIQYFPSHKILKCIECHETVSDAKSSENDKSGEKVTLRCTKSLVFPGKM